MTIKLTQHKPLAPVRFGRQEDFFFCYALSALGCCGRFKMVYSTKAETPIDQVH